MAVDLGVVDALPDSILTLGGVHDPVDHIRSVMMPEGGVNSE